MDSKNALHDDPAFQALAAGAMDAAEGSTSHLSFDPVAPGMVP
jgi:hypothetical protein